MARQGGSWAECSRDWITGSDSHLEMIPRGEKSKSERCDIEDEQGESIESIFGENGPKVKGTVQVSDCSLNLSHQAQSTPISLDSSFFFFLTHASLLSSSDGTQPASPQFVSLKAGAPGVTLSFDFSRRTTKLFPSQAVMLAPPVSGWSLMSALHRVSGLPKLLSAGFCVNSL